MQLILNNNGESSVVNVSDGMLTVADLKVQLSATMTIGDILLSHESQFLDDDVNLASLAPGSCIDVSVGLMGGKVHGSLARAGKVRGQTPKVAKKEKKQKKKTGRAKRRIQYNRRFVNVVTVPGRKKGPNAQSQ